MSAHRTAPSATQQLNDVHRLLTELRSDVKAILAKLDMESPTAAAGKATGANRAFMDRHARRARGDACPQCDDVGVVLNGAGDAEPCPRCGGRP